jgi:glycosyltransferase involved in cell wall biosynthesis
MGKSYQTGILGVSGLEAMAMGIPVLSQGPDSLLIEYRKLWGKLPFFPTTREELALHLETFKNSPDGPSGLMTHWANRGKDYVRKWHNPKDVAERAIALYEEVLDAKQ